MHWSASNSRGGRVCALVNPLVDPFSGQPEAKLTPVSLRKLVLNWEATLLLRGEWGELPSALSELADYVVMQRAEGCRRYLLGGKQAADWLARAGEYLPARNEGDWLEFSDPNAGVYRCALLRADRLEALLFAGPPGDSRQPGQWIDALMQQDSLESAQRRVLLSGGSPGDGIDPGATVCACFGVGERTIAEAIDAGCDSLDALAAQLKCGSNCGACRPELGILLASRKAG
jgi:assimilatory nitrate reductase catalytic subunit